jgi:hypothetical protein
MSPETIVAILGAAVIVLTIATVVYKKAPRRVKQQSFTRKWRDVQKLCAHQETWPQAVIKADELVDDVLKRKQKHGKTMGERMVAAQKLFSNNDMLWHSHKLASHIRHSAEEVRLKEKDVKEALVGFRQALRDLGAL